MRLPLRCQQSHSVPEHLSWDEDPSALGKFPANVLALSSTLLFRLVKA